MKEPDAGTDGGEALGGGVGGGGGGGATGGGAGGATGGGTGGGGSSSCANPTTSSPVATADAGLLSSFIVTPGGDAISTCADGGLSSVLQFTLADTRDVGIYVRALDGGSVDASISVRLGSCQTGMDLACANSRVTGSSEIVRLPDLAAGTYVVLVALPGSASATAVEVGVEVTGFPPIANDNCSAAEPLFFINGTATAFGRTLGATDSTRNFDSSPTCNYGSRRNEPDVVYSYTLTAKQDVTLTVNPRSSFAPLFYVRRACDGVEALDELLCSFALSGTAVLLNQEPGTYFLWVDGSVSTGGDAGFDGYFDLVVSISTPLPPPPNDLCNRALPLFPDGGAYSIVTGTTLGATNNYTNPCQPFHEADVVYEFTTTTPQRLVAMARPISADGGAITPALRVLDGGTLIPGLMVLPRSMCSADGGLNGFDGSLRGTPGCATGYIEHKLCQLSISELPANNYLLLVDSADRSQGAFELEASLKPVEEVAANDTCMTATELLFDPTGTARAIGNTRDAGNDHIGQGCTFGPSVYSDSVYRFRTPPNPTGDGGIAVRIDAMSLNASELDPAVFLRTNCETDAGIQLACSRSESPSRPVALGVARGLAAATDYFVWVEGGEPLRSAGPFALSVHLEENPTNETCATATPLPFNTSLSGTNLAASDDYSVNNIYGPSCPGYFEGPDVVYTFTSTTAGEYRVLVTPEIHTGLEVSVFKIACTGTSNCLASTTTYTRAAGTLVLSATANTTYFVIVDTTYDYNGNNGWPVRGLGGFTIGVSH